MWGQAREKGRTQWHSEPREAAVKKNRLLGEELGGSAMKNTSTYLPTPLFYVPVRGAGRRVEAGELVLSRDWSGQQEPSAGCKRGRDFSRCGGVSALVSSTDFFTLYRHSSQAVTPLRCFVFAAKEQRTSSPLEPRSLLLGDFVCVWL